MQLFLHEKSKVLGAIASIIFIIVTTYSALPLIHGLIRSDLSVHVSVDENIADHTEFPRAFFVGNRLTIRITNNSSRLITGLLIQNSEPRTFTRASVSGDFISHEELEKLRHSFRQADGSSTFPKLPSLPPNGSIKVTAYGYFGNNRYSTNIEITADNATSTVYRESISFQGPSREFLTSFLPFILICALPICPFVVIITRDLIKGERRRLKQSDKPSILFDLACEQAADGKGRDAITILTLAIEKGFDDFAMIERDPHLSGLKHLKSYTSVTDKINEDADSE